MRSPVMDLAVFCAGCVATFVLVCMLVVFLTSRPASKPEPCVTVGTFDNGRTIIVCDAEAARRWAK